MKIIDFPINERPREKILRQGVNALSGAELLAVFICTGTKGRTAIDIARQLLHEHKTLRNILTLPAKKLLATKGIGKAKLSMLHAALELGTRCLEENLETSAVITQAREVQNYFIAQFSGCRQEVFACLFLDAKHQMIKFEKIFTGSINFTPVYPRVIAQKALEYNAQAVIFAHNHPSNNLKPSKNDIETTLELVAILKVLDIKVLDHIIVGTNRCNSFAELGIL